MGVPKIRKPSDKTKNNLGNFLLNFCRNYNMHLMNGRLEEGKLTTIKSTVVDYCISSIEILKYVIYVSVLDFSKLYSDIHMPLLCETCVNTQTQNVFNSVDTYSIERSIFDLPCINKTLGC